MLGKNGWIPNSGIKNLMVNENAKVYCILFDAMPMTEFIFETAERKKANFFGQVGGTFTINSLAGMFTGFLPSELEKNGIGHLLRERYRDKKTRIIHWPWEESILTTKLIKNGWKIRLHNGKYFLTTIQDLPEFKKSDSFNIINKKISSFRRKKYTLREKTFLSAEFQRNEIKNIKKMQAEEHKCNTFYFIRYDHFHIAQSWRSKETRKRSHISATKLCNEIMTSWNLDEPNSLFWIFSDHGDWNSIKKHLNPRDYFKWVLFKDNIRHTSCRLPSVISNRDFYPTLMEKFGYSHDYPSDSLSIFKEQDKNRVFFTEDGRERIDKYNSSSAVACRFTKWKGNIPSQMIYVSWYKKKKEFKCKRAFLNEKMIITNYESLSVMDKELKTALINRFKWVRE